MKKNLLIILFIVTSSFILIGCDNKEDSSVKNKNLLDEKVTRYVIMEDDKGEEYKIYYYGIESAIITIGDDNYDFEQAILSGVLTLDEILEDMELDASLYDGGTKIYRDGGTKKYFSESYSIIKCNTIDGNRDIYIGDNELEYQDGFCEFKTTEAEIKLQEEVKKMESTKKVIVKNTYNNDIINTVTNEDEIKKIIDMISNSTESTLPVTSEGTNLIIQMFNKDDRLITSMAVYRAGYFGFDGGKEYYVEDEDIDFLKDLIKG